jgi:hypothetical protein
MPHIVLVRRPRHRKPVSLHCLHVKLPKREIRVQNRLPIFQYFYASLEVTKS